MMLCASYGHDEGKRLQRSYESIWMDKNNRSRKDNRVYDQVG